MAADNLYRAPLGATWVAPALPLLLSGGAAGARFAAGVFDAYTGDNLLQAGYGPAVFTVSAGHARFAITTPVENNPLGYKTDDIYRAPLGAGHGGTLYRGLLPCLLSSGVVSSRISRALFDYNVVQELLAQAEPAEFVGAWGSGRFCVSRPLANQPTLWNPLTRWDLGATRPRSVGLLPALLSGSSFVGTQTRNLQLWPAGLRATTRQVLCATTEAVITFMGIWWPAEAGTFLAEPQGVDLHTARRLPVGTGAVLLGMADAITNAPHKRLAANALAISVGGGEVGGRVARRHQVAVAGVSIGGVPVAVRCGRRVSATQVSLSVVGHALGTLKGFKVLAGAAPYAVGGYWVAHQVTRLVVGVSGGITLGFPGGGLFLAKRLSAAQALFAVGVCDATLGKTRLIRPAVEMFNAVAWPAPLRRDAVLVVDTSECYADGPDAAVLRAFVAPLSTGGVSVSWRTARTLVGRRVVAATGFYGWWNGWPNIGKERPFYGDHAIVAVAFPPTAIRRQAHLAADDYLLSVEGNPTVSPLIGWRVLVATSSPVYSWVPDAPAKAARLIGGGRGQVGVGGSAAATVVSRSLYVGPTAINAAGQPTFGLLARRLVSASPRVVVVTRRPSSIYKNIVYVVQLAERIVFRDLNDIFTFTIKNDAAILIKTNQDRSVFLAGGSGRIVFHAEVDRVVLLCGSDRKIAA